MKIPAEVDGYVCFLEGEDKVHTNAYEKHTYIECLKTLLHYYMLPLVNPCVPIIIMYYDPKVYLLPKS